MIICRAPFRISFFGGGTDYPAWYREHGGVTISSTINKYCFVTLRYLPPFFDYKYRVRYTLREEANTIDEIEHPSVRECLRYLEIQDGVDLVHHADLPAQSGIGSSSTFTVCLLHAIYAMRGQMPTKYQLAKDAIHVEQELIGESVGSQDQVAAAFGGLNRIEYGGVSEVTVHPLVISRERLRELESRLMLFFTGFSRRASLIAQEQIRLIPTKGKELSVVADIAREAEAILTDESRSIEEWGTLLDDQWNVKRRLSPLVTNEAIDEIYRRGKIAGAAGGKLLGAGGGGFILFLVRPDDRERVRGALSELLHVPIELDFSGSQIVYYAHHS